MPLQRRGFLRLVALLGLGGAGSALAACAGPATPAASPAPPAAPVPLPSPPGASAPAAASGSPTHLSISYSETTPEIAWFWVTLEAGIFARHGLDVETSQITSVQSMAAFLSGQTDIGNTGGPETLSAVASGADIVIVAVPNGVSPFRIYASLDISSMADLKGQSVGISQLGGAPDMQMRLAMQKAGVDPQDVSFSQTGSTQAETAALLAGSVKAIAANPLEGQTLLAQGMHVIYDLAGLREPWAEGTVTVRRDWMSQRRDVLQAFVDALVEGVQLYKTNKSYTVSVMEKYFKTSDDAAMATAYDAYVDLIPSPPAPTQAELTSIQTLLAVTNPAVASVDLGRLVDPEFVASAQARGLAG